MKIAIVSYMGYDGPGVMHAHHFANCLVERGHEVFFLLNGDSGTAKLMKERPRYRLEQVSFRHGVLAKRLRRDLDRFAPEIVHLWTPRHLPARVGLETWLAGDARLVIHYEDDEEFILAHAGGRRQFGRDDLELYSYFSQKRPDPERLRELAAAVNVEFLRETIHRPESWNWLHPVLSPVVEKLVDGRTTISKDYMAVLHERSSGPVRLLYPGVDMERFRPRAKPADLVAELKLENRSVLLYSGAIAPIHDFASVLRDLPPVARAHPEVVLVQIGKNHIPDLTERVVAEGGIRDNVRFVGQVPHHRMPDYLALADLFIGHVRSDFFNAHRLPSKIPEYMAAGRPMLVADHGFGEELEDGLEAVKVPGDAPGELTEGMLRAFELRDSWAAMGASLRRKAGQLFDWERNTEGLEEFYGELLEAPRAVALEGAAQATPLTFVDLGFSSPEVAVAGPEVAATEPEIAGPAAPEESPLDGLTGEELAAEARRRIIALRERNEQLAREVRRLGEEKSRLAETARIMGIQITLLRRIPLASPIWRLIKRWKYPHLASSGRG